MRAERRVNMMEICGGGGVFSGAVAADGMHKKKKC